MNIITTYVNPDLDGFASVFAYLEFMQKFGTDAKIYIEGNQNLETQYLVSKLAIDISGISARGITIMDKVHLVDTSHVFAISRSISLDQVIEIVDHHVVNDADKFANAQKQIEPVGAAATLITEKYSQRNLKPSLSSAVLLYCAIASNTLRFKASVTDDKDIRMAKYIESIFPHVSDYVEGAFQAKSDLSGEKLEQSLMNDLSKYNFAGKSVGVFQLEVYNGRDVINNRLQEVLAIIKKVKDEKLYDYVFLTCIDLQNFCNVFVAIDEESIALVSKTLNVNFIGGVAERNGYIMRKEIMPSLKVSLEVS